jgi:ABC-type uncharacterized transport system substrate-binding protein
MFEIIRRLALGAALIALAAGVLLYTDRGSRNRARKSFSAQAPAGKVWRVALVQHASLSVLEQGAEGLLGALAERGYTQGGRLQIRRFNAEGDMGTANAIAKEVTGGDFDLLLTISTVSLQTVHNANRLGARTPHVFGLVTDPYSAGVGIEATNHLIHPPYLAGAGSLQPIENILRTAWAMRPELKSVGLVWNAAEANSLVQTKIARRVCAELGLNLIEANAENTAGVVESANSVIARGAECMFLTGDVTVGLATDQVLDVCRRAGIPAFSALPPTVSRGSLFDMGANYVEIGRHMGEIAADVLEGNDPMKMPIDNFVPVVFLYNEAILPSLRDRWTIPETVKREATGWITATSTNLPALTAAAKKAGPKLEPGRTYKIGLAYFAPDPAADSCIKGIFDGLREYGFQEGKNLEVRRAHAQAEIPNISAMLQNFDSSDVDLILPMSTPVISGACGLVKQKPVVFTFCSDPIAAGAGKSFTNHLPFVTGIGSFPPVQDMVEVIRKTLPAAKSVGTIYNASEANSVKVISVARDLFARAGFKLEEVTVASPSEVLQAAQALAGRSVDALYIQGDNTVVQGFDAVVKATRDAKLPLFVDDPDTAKRGALACVGLGYYRPGLDLGRFLARVLTGESPAGIPIENISEKIIWLDLPQADRLGIKFPAEIIKETEPKAAQPADKGSKQAAAPSGPFKVDVIEYIDTPNVEDNREGIDAVCQISDNLTGASFASVAQATQRARLPLMAFASAQVKNGAFMAVSRDFFDGGVASGQIAARVLRGESPAGIPFQLVENLKYVFNRRAAAAAGVTIPQELLRRGQATN